MDDEPAKRDQSEHQEPEVEEEVAIPEGQDWSILGSDFNEKLFEPYHEHLKQSRSQRRRARQQFAKSHRTQLVTNPLDISTEKSCELQQKIAAWVVSAKQRTERITQLGPDSLNERLRG